MHVNLVLTRDPGEHINQDVLIGIATALTSSIMQQHYKDTDLLQLEASTALRPTTLTSQASAERASAGQLNPSSIITRKDDHENQN